MERYLTILETHSAAINAALLLLILFFLLVVIVRQRRPQENARATPPGLEGYSPGLSLPSQSTDGEVGEAEESLKKLEQFRAEQSNNLFNATVDALLDFLQCPAHKLIEQNPYGAQLAKAHREAEALADKLLEGFYSLSFHGCDSRVTDFCRRTTFWLTRSSYHHMRWANWQDEFASRYDKDTFDSLLDNALKFAKGAADGAAKAYLGVSLGLSEMDEEGGNALMVQLDQLSSQDLDLATARSALFIEMEMVEDILEFDYGREMAEEVDEEAPVEDAAPKGKGDYLCPHCNTRYKNAYCPKDRIAL